MSIEFGQWEQEGQIYTAIRFPIIGGGKMLVQVCMPPKPIGAIPAQAVSRLALGLPLGALGQKEMLEGDEAQSALAVNACLDALDKSKENPEILELLKQSSDPAIQKALLFLDLQ